MAVGTDYDIMFLSVWIQGLIFIQRKRVVLEILSERCERRLLGPRRIAAGICNKEVLWIDLDVDVRLLAISVIFNDDKS